MLRLVRWGHAPHGTFGTLVLPGGWSCYTVERRWKDNLPNISCIPTGTYSLEEKRFNRGNYDTYELLDVPNRSAILIHAANWSEELFGCIAPGLQLSMMTRPASSGEPRPLPEWCVKSSRPALESLLSKLRNMVDPQIEIRWDDPLCGGG